MPRTTRSPALRHAVPLLAALLACFVSERATAGEAARVAWTNPPNLAYDLDPRLGEIEVRFDREMARDSWSWTRGNAEFPKAGDPYFKDPWTAVLPVKLKPGRTYEIGVNGGGCSGFRDRDGTPAEPFRIVFTTLSRAAESPEPANREATATLRNAIDHWYSYRDIRDVDWDALFAEHDRSLATATHTGSYALAVAEMMARVGDPHIAVEVGDVDIWPFVPDRHSVFDLEVVGALVDDLRQRSSAVWSGHLDGGIGYLLIGTWSNGDAAAVRAAIDALRGLEDAPALVVDVRPNGGGDESLAREFAGCFVRETAVYARHIVVEPGASSGFSLPDVRTVDPNTQGPAYRGPVAVLSGPSVMSSCEAFLLMMRQVPGARVFGQPSFGSSGNPQPVDLGNGVTIWLPSWRSMTPEGELFEGTGLQPDVLVPTSAEELAAGRDPVLEAALRALQEELAARASGEAQPEG